MSKNTKIIFSFIVLFIGLLILFSEYFNSKKISVYDYMNKLYYNQVVEVGNIEEINDESKKNKENNEEEEVEDTNYKFSNEQKTTYIGYLNIPSINLKKGFTSKEDKNNVVSKNIEILEASDYPDKELGNVILASHSGNSSISFFNKLYLLNEGDLVYIEYNNINYTYKITNIYTIPKTGKAEIKRNKNISTLTLITCTRSDKTTQTVYISELIEKE